MIVLDTNVLSEMMKTTPHDSVRNWLNQQDGDTLYITSVALAEILFGIAALPGGKRKNMLDEAARGLRTLFEGRILSFDSIAAQYYAELAVQAKVAGKGFPVPDGYIAAIAAAHRFIVASRDTAPFQAVGVRVINPWEMKAENMHAG